MNPSERVNDQWRNEINNVADVVQELMFDDSDQKGEEDFPDLWNVPLNGMHRSDNRNELGLMTTTGFEKFDASFKIDEMTPFHESINFETFGLDSSYCTSNTSEFTKNSSFDDLSFAQDSALSFTRNSHHKPALLDTSHSQDDDNNSVSSSSSFSFPETSFATTDPLKAINKQRTNSMNGEFTRKSRKDSKQIPSLSRTSPSRKIRSNTSSSETKPAELESTFKNMNDCLERRSGHQKTGKRIVINSDIISSSSHHSQSSRRNTLKSPRRRVGSKYRLVNESGHSSTTELSSSSHHSQSAQRQIVRTTGLRQPSRENRGPECDQLSFTTVSVESSHSKSPNFKDLNGCVQRKSVESSSTLTTSDMVQNSLDLRVGKKALSDSQHRPLSLSHHSQSRRRRGLDSPRRRNRNSTQIEQGKLTNVETGVEFSQSTDIAKTKNPRRTRSRSQPRLIVFDGKRLGETSGSESRSRVTAVEKQSEINVTIVDHPSSSKVVEAQDKQVHSDSETQMDPHTAARIERARISRAKHLAKIQKEKEKARHERRNVSLLHNRGVHA